jgi:uncharacterized protein YkwD
MTIFPSSFQRLTAAMALIALLAPLSAFAEPRPMTATDMRRMAAELQAAIDRAHAQNRNAERPTSRKQVPSATAGAASFSALDVLDQMNAVRREHGLRPLQMNRALTLAAGDRIDDMFTRRYFDHVAPDGTQPFVRATNRGYRYMTIGENLAAGQRTAQQVVADWMNSPGHRANILGRAFEDCGIAVAPGSPVAQSRGYTFVVLYASEARSRRS